MLSTETIDESVAEEHLRHAYRVAELEPPVAVRWFDSPLAFEETLMKDRVERAMGYNWMFQPVKDRLQARIGWSLSLWQHVEYEVGWHGVLAGVWHPLRNNLLDLIPILRGGDDVPDHVRSYFDAGWLAATRFVHEVFEPNDLIHLALFNEMVSGYLPGSKVAWLIRKPIRLERDAQGRLHSEDGSCSTS